jgi:PAS domain S-box-containing protein
LLLVVDDHADSRALLSTILGSAGHEVVEAPSGEDALVAARRRRPGLIIADILMRGMDGYEFVRQLRGDPDVGTTRVVFYTATYAIDEVGQLAAQCGVEHVLMKPCEPEQILETVRQALDAGPTGAGGPAAATFDHDHAKVLNDKLIARTEELAAAASRYADISDELLASEQQFRLLFERNPLPMIVYERESLQIVSVNTAVVEAYGYPRAELLSMTVTELHPQNEVDALLAHMAEHPGGSKPEAMGGASGVCWHHRHRDGTVIDVETTGANLVLHGVQCRIVLCQNVTDRRQAAAALENAHDQAVEASNLKSAFLANMSHEIRTPMNGVIGMTELLLGTELGREQRGYALQIASSSDELMMLIEDVLDISRLGAGQLELDCVDFDLYEIVEEACSVADQEAQSKGVNLELDIDEAVPRLVNGDPRRVRQVLANLTSNAVKFTAEGVVKVRLMGAGTRAADRRIRCEVSDTGLGVDPEVLQRMFEPFTQADVSTTRRHGGTGLGLAIASNLIELMGGTIGADSKLGSGSTFWFELALGAPVAGDPVPAHRGG